MHECLLTEFYFTQMELTLKLQALHIEEFSRSLALTKFAPNVNANEGWRRRMLKSFSWEIIRDMTSFLKGRKILNTKEKLINKDFLKHKQANINVKSRRFGVIVTPFSRQSGMNRSFSLSRNKKINRKPFSG